MSELGFIFSKDGAVEDFMLFVLRFDKKNLGFSLFKFKDHKYLMALLSFCLVF